MSYIRKELFCLRDWRGKPLDPPLADAGLEWLTVVPAITGKVVVIEFWATWCRKCLESVKLLNEIHAQLGADVVVIGITEDVPEKAINWVKTNGVQYYAAHDPERKFHSQIGIKGLPNLVALDGRGVVQWQGILNAPEDPFTVETVRKIVERSKKPPAQIIPVTEDLFFAGQPTEEQLRNINLIGVNSVLNLRADGEPGVIPNEGKIVPVAYAQIPIKGLNDIDEATISKIVTKIGELPKPCLVHCGVGMRASAAVLLKVAFDEKASRHQFCEWGAGLGFNFSDQSQFFQVLGKVLPA